MKRFLVLATALLWLLLPSVTFAYNPLDNACGAQDGNGATADTKSASVCGTDGSNTIYGSGSVLEKTTILLAGIAGIVAVIVVVVAGFIYVTSGGNSARTESARNALIGALVGLVLIACAASIITFVVNKV